MTTALRAASPVAPAAAGAPPADVSTPAVLLKFDANVMHHGSLGAIRSLGRMGVPVYAVQEAAWAPAAHSRYLRGRVLWHPAGLSPDQVQAGLAQLSDTIGRRAVLLPTDDAGAIFLAEYGERLRDRYLFAQPPAPLPRRLAGKYSLHELCTELGVPSPRSCVPSTHTQAARFAAETGYPVIGKLTRPWQAAPGQRSTVIIADRAELDGAWQASQASQAGLMLQQHIPAGPGSDWFFHGYRGAGGCMLACTGVKERSYPAHAGLTSFGRSVPNAALRDDVTGLLDQLGYHGIADLDLRLDASDGRYKLLDFNPRLGAQFRLFATGAGLDVVRAAYLDLTGQEVAGAEPGGVSPVAGRSFVVENYDPLSALAYWRSGELGIRAWLASLRTADETAWFARDDLRPFGLMCLRMGWRVATRPLARGRKSPAADRLAVPRLRRGRAWKSPRIQQGQQPVPAEGGFA
jgi:D-aspartate ligase